MLYCSFHYSNAMNAVLDYMKVASDVISIYDSVSPPHLSINPHWPHLSRRSGQHLSDKPRNTTIINILRSTE